MDDEAAFVAAIAAAPEDTHLPLIFADWLDDHGDPRGQWIRHHHIREWMKPTYASPVPKLLESLAKDKRVIEVRRATEAIGGPIVPGLVELLKHETPRVREQACLCLRKIGKRAKEAVPALLEALGDKDASVREQAAKALKDIGTRDVAPTENLKAALNDDNWSVRRVASKVLGSMRAKGSVLQELIEKYESPDKGDRLAVVGGLAELGTADVLPALGKALSDPEPEVRERAVQALGRTKLAGAAELALRAMKDRSAKVRVAAVQQFGRYSYFHPFPLTAAAVEAICERLGDTVEDVRAAACYTLLQVPTDLAAAVVPRIIPLLDDMSDRVRTNAAHVLGGIGHGSEAALRALLGELDDPNTEHRRIAVWAVGQIGLNDPAALHALLPLLRDHGSGVAASVTGLLGKWERLPASAAPALLARVATARGFADDGSLAAALAALGRVEKPTRPILAALRAGLREPIGDGLARASALGALAQLGPAAVPVLPDVLELFQPENGNLHHELYNLAARALLAMGPPGVAELARLLDGDNADAHQYVIHGLHPVGARALPLLPAYLRLFARLSPDDWHRGQVLNALRDIGPDAADATIPHLFAVLEGDANGYTKITTLHALRGFGVALLPHLPKLVALSERPEADARLDAFASLFAALAPDPAVREPLRALLRRAAGPAGDGPVNYPHHRARGYCGRGLLKFKDPALVPDLAPLVTDADVTIRREFVPRIALLDSPAVVPLMRRALTDTDDGVRLGALVLDLRGDSSDETVAALVAALEDRSPKVRRAAVEALAKLGAVSDAVLSALQAATEDSDKQTAVRAGVALRKFTPKEPKARSKKSPAQAKGKRTPG